MNKEKQKESKEEAETKTLVETIASNIEHLSRTVSGMLGGRLKKEAVVVLLMNSTKMPRYQVEQVMTALMNLEKDFLNHE